MYFNFIREFMYLPVVFVRSKINSSIFGDENKNHLAGRPAGWLAACFCRQMSVSILRNDRKSGGGEGGRRRRNRNRTGGDRYSRVQKSKGHHHCITNSAVGKAQQLLVAGHPRRKQKLFRKLFDERNIPDKTPSQRLWPVDPEALE